MGKVNHSVSYNEALDADPFQKPAQVELVPLSRVLPDRYQARLALPPEIKKSFFAGEIDCYEAARQLLIAADGDPGLFHMVNELRLLGQSILNERQIEPATGQWINENGAPVFFLETGERRFWSLAVEAVARGLPEEPLLRVLAEHGTSRQRQVVENLMREDLCAVEMGKAVATMILESLDIYPEDGEDEMDYYRRALQIKRLPSNTWPEIERITGYSRPVLYRHSRILSLPDDLLYLATLYRLPEAVLRDIVTSPPDRQRGMLLSVIEERLAQSEESRAGGTSSSQEGVKSNSSDPSPNLRRKRAERLMLALKPLIRQSQADDGFDRIAEDLSALLDPQGRKTVAAALRSLAQGLRDRP
jgi:hypothetical protein